MASTLAAVRPVTGDPVRTRKFIYAWLMLLALTIMAMVVVGGITRLTHSGLSITEWQLVHGVIPPLNDAQWQEEFSKYQQIPEYQIVNPDMTLSEFKGIFWWEWAHRMLGRVIGLAVLLPLLFLWGTGRLEKVLQPKLLTIFGLVVLQGIVGWWMVQSGLTERTDVSQYRLAIHLSLACILLAYVTWVAQSLSRAPAPLAPVGYRRVAGFIVIAALAQIFLGGLVAGSNAGMTFNTWPYMDGALVPSGLLIQTPFWRNFFENVATIQFDHRIGAYVLLIAAIFHYFQTRRSLYGAAALGVAWLIAAQALVGIGTLIFVVPMVLALLHQFGAVLTVFTTVVHLRGMSPPLPAPAPATAGG